MLAMYRGFAELQGWGFELLERVGTTEGGARFCSAEVSGDGELSRPPARLPTYLPAGLPARLPTFLPVSCPLACPPACVSACRSCPHACFGFGACVAPSDIPGQADRHSTARTLHYYSATRTPPVNLLVRCCTPPMNLHHIDGTAPQYRSTVPVSTALHHTVPVSTVLQ